MANKLIRLLCDIDDKSGNILDAITDEAPFFHVGDSVDLQIAVARSGSLEAVASSGESINLDIKASETGSALFSLTDNSLDNTLDISAWKLGTKQHASFSLTAVQSATLTGASYYLHIYYEVGSEVVTAFLGKLEVRGNSSTPSSTESNFYTKTEADAKFPQYKSTITSETGGTSSDLDGQATADGAVTTGTMWIIRNTDGSIDAYETWLLVDNPGSASAGDVVLPTDYHASTNNRGWKNIT